ncbi:tRNA 4-thiouridine(8) synthase ThiI [Alkalibaculum sp. M08DMB]|uniref:Probable tRNA sulfurtransferase n=1 Tax=Alkalibaculum sporogenes TaxID=2655001 RepID=A0A6A7K9W3_9FIRM|nr:tRNA uracil 4-sulfurtransferase ThiI [Alkalibaculum sporogenes]MPW26329.1 tRNA 4-thiouridine(8) synthase ThiI [Alkalibaculum sporogenes]
MEKVILVRYGEIALKGLNKSFFIDMLLKNIKASLKGLNGVKLEKIQGRFIIRVALEDFDRALDLLRKVFGIVSISEAKAFPNDFEQIKRVAVNMMECINEDTTFKVEARRANKGFSLTSMEINNEVGGHLLDNNQYLKVDVKKPEVKLYIEVREKTYMYSSILQGLGGLPVGCSGKGVLMLSGGIDSPVAGYLMAKRGVEIIAVHFHSFPYTSERARDKVIKLTEIMQDYTGPIKLYIVSFTDIQQELLLSCNERYTTLLMRRIMMKIAERIAIAEEAKALISGESLAQVASQTMESLIVTDNAVELPVYRPLIGMDKNEIIDISQKIDTFETSILPYEDCCTVFVPKHPETRPKLEKILIDEQKIDIEHLIQESINTAEIITM